MKAIFLDIDGVLATPTSVRLNYLLGRGPHNQWYDGVALTYLGRLVQQTGAVIVLASTWREDLTSTDPYMRSIMDNLLNQLEQVDAPIYDTTPIIRTADRSGEIGAWLDKHPCEAWVILDDLATFTDRPDVADGRVVCIEDSEGIRWQHYRRALDILETEAARVTSGVLPDNAASF